MSIPGFRLYLISDRHLSHPRSLETSVSVACAGGVRAVQLREKDLHGRRLFDLAARLRDITTACGAQLYINDRIDIAMATDADGVQLTERSLSVPVARKVIGSKLIMQSTHALSAAITAERDGADAILFGPIFETPSKRDYGPPQGLDLLREVVDAVQVAVYAVGGISPKRAEQCLSVGAAGVAVVSAIMASPDIRRTLREFQSALGEL